jgi:hypothetical protein
MEISGPNVDKKRHASNEMSDQRQNSSGKPRISTFKKTGSDSRNMLARTEGHFTEYMENDPRTWK